MRVLFLTWNSSMVEERDNLRGLGIDGRTVLKRHAEDRRWNVTNAVTNIRFS
jgi:hypothetical protein